MVGVMVEVEVKIGKELIMSNFPYVQKIPVIDNGEESSRYLAAIQFPLDKKWELTQCGAILLFDDKVDFQSFMAIFPNAAGDKLVDKFLSINLLTEQECLDLYDKFGESVHYMPLFENENDANNFYEQFISCIQ